VWKVSYRFRRMDVVGDTLTAFGVVTELAKTEEFGLATLDVGIRNSRGDVSTEGKATVALPFVDGPSIPYPFPGVADPANAQ
jgi:acyl dehydratase